MTDLRRLICDTHLHSRSTLGCLGSPHSHLPRGGAPLGPQELVAVVELQVLLGDPDIDWVSRGGDAEADLLPVHAHHPDRAGSTSHPGPISAVLSGTTTASRGPQRAHRRGLLAQEPLRRGGHLQPLVGSVSVVVTNPLIELGLRGLEIGDDPVGAELGAHRPMEPLDLPRRGR